MVNIQNAGCYFLNLIKVDALQAHKLIAEQLIHNKYLKKLEEKCMSQRKNTNANCHLVALPLHKKFKKSKEVFDNTKYKHWKCMCGDTWVRMYCQCTPGTFYCAECYASHHIEEDRCNNEQAEFTFFLKNILFVGLYNCVEFPEFVYHVVYTNVEQKKGFSYIYTSF